MRFGSNPFSMSSKIISSHDHRLTTHLMISFLLCCDQLVAFGKAISYPQEKLSFLPSFLACNPFCFCFAATGSTSPLSQDGLCRFYFFSLIPQTHFLTRMTKISDDFWFLNKKTKQIQLSGSNLTESSVFLPLCSLVCVKSLLDINQANNQPASQPASQDLFPANFYVPEVILTLGGKK